MSLTPTPASTSNAAIISPTTDETNLMSLLKLSQSKNQESHAQETESLRATIDELLIRLDAHFDAVKDKAILEELVGKLRDANQHLVLASVASQYLQEAAELAKQKQEQFLAMLAHELRNPLAPIMMATELMAKLTENIVDKNEQLPRLHGIISRQTQHLSHLVDDLLDASRISSGKIRLHKQKFSVKEIIENAIETSWPSIQLRHQQLRCTLQPTPLFLFCDFLRLSQVFSNLLINASKFSPEYEQIDVIVTQQHDRIIVVVRDKGIGIASEIQASIFGLFSQGFQTADRAQGGLGIGLALVKMIVEMHEGSVQVKSDGLGLGSEFKVELPLCDWRQESPTILVPKELKVSPLRILIVEDNIDTVSVVSEVLIAEGHYVEFASNGVAAVKLFEQLAPPSFDVVICDLGLPYLDGFTVASRIRVLNLQPRPFLIAFTGYNQLEDRHRAESVGFDHYLVKPVASEVLLSVIAQCSRS